MEIVQLWPSYVVSTIESQPYRFNLKFIFGLSFSFSMSIVRSLIKSKSL